MTPITPFVFRTMVILSVVFALVGPLLNALFLPSLPVEHSRLIIPSTTLVFTALVLFNFLLGITTAVGFCTF